MTEQRSRPAWVRVLRYTLLTGAIAVSIALFAFGIWIIRLDRNIQTRFAENRFAPPVEFYSAPQAIRPGMTFEPGYFENYFARRNYRRRAFGQPIQPGDYSIWTADDCLTLTLALLPESGSALSQCIAYRNEVEHVHESAFFDEQVKIVAIDTSNRVIAILTAPSFQTVPAAYLEPELFAQHYGDKPILRRIVSLGDVPTHCLNALIAIEDANFLEHPGVSVTGLLRAFRTLLTPGQRAQGGSTITQQLVKNYFLTDERTFRRKFTEMVMALIVEQRASKDEILETYINLIYMGQNGPFQVRGFAAASEHYFGRPLEDLNLEQCALLAGVLNNPGHLNPFNAPERAQKRRTRVLERMRELNYISDEQFVAANAAPLPSRPQRSLTEPAPYFVQAVRQQIHKLGIDESEGLRVYTTLNLRAQEAAHRAVRQGLDRLESTHPRIKKIKQQGRSLEAALIAADPLTGAVEALVGGRGYLLTQFNRAVDSQRQVGSVMKPFVYLAALETLTPEGTPYSPLTVISDRETTHRFEGQKWTPKNYDGVFHDDIPLYWALKESLNAATANLGISVGLSNIIDVSKRLGITSRIEPLPSLTLGAFELRPIEVLQAYTTLARLGDAIPLTLVRRIDDLSGNKLFEPGLEREIVANREAVAELVGILKQAVENGTARSVRRLGFLSPAAGKTGTTNDKKDAWFAGFTPYHASVVWVGYDDNTSHDLTGATGAVPIWTAYMKSYATIFPPDDFPWPPSVERIILSAEQQRELGVPEKPTRPLEPVELIVRK